MLAWIFRLQAWKQRVLPGLVNYGISSIVLTSQQLARDLPEFQVSGEANEQWREFLRVGKFKRTFSDP